MEFYVSDSISRSVLHWIDRNYPMQTLGEAIRVTKQYLIVSDFAPHQPYRVIYMHAPQWRTFQMAYQQLIVHIACAYCRVSIATMATNGTQYRPCCSERFLLRMHFPCEGKRTFRRGNM